MDLGLSRPRSAALLLASGALLLGALHWARSAPGSAPDAFTAGLQTGAAWLLVGCAGWLVAVSAALLAEAVAGRRRAPRWCTAPQILRRWVTITSGVALSVGLAAPALAGSSPGADLPSVDGLQLPVRASGESATGAAPHGPAPVIHEVRAGDSLWRIARDRTTTADDGDVASLVARIHHLNHDVIGPDPDILRPGQRLVLPEEVR